VSADYQKTLDLMDRLLRNMPATELLQPAVVRDPANAFKGFQDGEPNYIHMLIRPNPEYFDKRLADAIPQFFTVSVRAEPALIASKELADAFVKAFRFERLKQLLGK